MHVRIIYIGCAGWSSPRTKFFTAATAAAAAAPTTTTTTTPRQVQNTILLIQEFKSVKTYFGWCTVIYTIS
jgi:phospholipase C